MNDLGQLNSLTNFTAMLLFSVFEKSKENNDTECTHMQMEVHENRV